MLYGIHKIEIQISDLSYKPHGWQSLRYIIYCSTDARFYPPIGSKYHTLLCLDKLRGPTQHQVKFLEDPIKNNEVYNVISHKHVGKLYHVLSRNHAGKHTPHYNDYVQKYLNTRENIARSYIHFIWVLIIQLMRNNRNSLWYCIYVTKLTTNTPPYLHKILLDAHHKPQHTNKIIHTTILMYTYLYNILPANHHTTLQILKITLTKIFAYLTFTHTRKPSTKKLSEHANLPRLQHNFTTMLGWGNSPNNTWGPNLNPGISNVKAPGLTTYLSTLKHTLVPDMDRPSKTVQRTEGHYLIYYLWILLMLFVFESSESNNTKNSLQS